MRNALSLLAAVVICTTLTGLLRAADAAAPAAAPAGAPAGASPTSAPAAPHKVAVPPGFKVVSVKGRNALCEPADEPWVATALGKAQATTKPSTMPADLLTKLMAQRTPLLQQLARDLALSDLTGPAAMYDKDLVGTIRAYADYKPAIYYLVATPDRLAALMRGGWSDPHFYYNRAADSVQFNPAGLILLDRPQDDILFPAAYDANDTPDKRGDALAATIGSTDALVQAYEEIKGRTTVGATFAQMVNDFGAKPLNLKDDQQWFGIGVALIYSARYAAAITGEDVKDLMDNLTMEHPANPLKTTAIDLIHPPDPKLMRQEAIPAYNDTLRRKSARVIRYLLEKGGDQAVPKAIVAIRDKKPADGAALVAVIKDATGVDLTQQVGRGS